MAALFEPFHCWSQLWVTIPSLSSLTYSSTGHLTHHGHSPAAIYLSQPIQALAVSLCPTLGCILLLYSVAF